MDSARAASHAIQSRTPAKGRPSAMIQWRARARAAAHAIQEAHQPEEGELSVTVEILGQCTLQVTMNVPAHLLA
jgi:hypothetical protein